MIEDKYIELFKSWIILKQKLTYSLNHNKFRCSGQDRDLKEPTDPYPNVEECRLFGQADDMAERRAGPALHRKRAKTKTPPGQSSPEGPWKKNNY